MNLYPIFKAAAKYGPTAKFGYQTAKKAYKSYRYQMAKRAIKRTQRSGFGGMATGYYQGRFKKPRRAVAGKFTKYLNYGYGTNVEVHGKVNDTDVVYIGASAFDQQHMYKIIVAALLRKLFKKAGHLAGSPIQELPLSAYNDSGSGNGSNAGFKLAWVFKSIDGTNTLGEYFLPNDASISSTAANCGLITYLNDIMSGTEMRKLDRIALYQADFRITTNLPDNLVNDNDRQWRLAAELDMGREVIELYSYFTLTVQNRTKGADTADTESDTVDNQPLHGKLFTFNGLPKLKTTGYEALEKVSALGIITTKSADLGNGQIYREPPVAKNFSNCVKQSKVLLNPGIIKSHSMTKTWRGYFNNVIFQWRAAYGISNGQIQFGSVIGPSCLIALEESLNSGSSNLITCTYEVDRKIGCMFVTARQPAMIADYVSAQQNNLNA